MRQKTSADLWKIHVVVLQRLVSIVAGKPVLLDSLSGFVALALPRDDLPRRSQASAQRMTRRTPG